MLAPLAYGACYVLKLVPASREQIKLAHGRTRRERLGDACDSLDFRKSIRQVKDLRRIVARLGCIVWRLSL